MVLLSLSNSSVPVMQRKQAQARKLLRTRLERQSTLPAGRSADRYASTSSHSQRRNRKHPNGMRSHERPRSGEGRFFPSIGDECSTVIQGLPADMLLHPGRIQAALSRTANSIKLSPWGLPEERFISPRPPVIIRLGEVCALHGAIVAACGRLWSMCLQLPAKGDSKVEYPWRFSV